MFLLLFGFWKFVRNGMIKESMVDEILMESVIFFVFLVLDFGDNVVKYLVFDYNYVEDYFVY